MEYISHGALLGMKNVCILSVGIKKCEYKRRESYSSRAACSYVQRRLTQSATASDTTICVRPRLHPSRSRSLPSNARLKYPRAPHAKIFRILFIKLRLVLCLSRQALIQAILRTHCGGGKNMFQLYFCKFISSDVLQVLYKITEVKTDVAGCSTHIEF